MYKELRHYAVVPFKAICGADRPGQTTTRIPDRVTCPECRKGMPAIHGDSGYFRFQAAIAFGAALAKEAMGDPERAYTPDTLADRAVELADALVKRLES